jgi:hypothetical protein
VLYICYRNLGRLCYIYITELLDDSVIIYMLQKSWTTLLLYICYRNLGQHIYNKVVQDFCNIYIITESSKISVTYIYNRVVQDFCSIYIAKSSKISDICYRNLGRLCYYIYVTEILDDFVIYMLQKSWTTLLYICYRNLGRLCYIYITELLDDSVIIYMLQKSWTTLFIYSKIVQDFCNIYIITESSKISVTYI